MLKILISGAIGFGIGYVVFKRPQDRAVEAAQRTWTAIEQAAQQTLPSGTSDPKLQGFGYFR